MKNNEMILTKEGLEDLKRELAERLEKRQTIALSIKQASEQGDLSENAAYKTAMKEKEFNENRISELQNMISIAKVTEGDTGDFKAGLAERIVVKRKSDGAEREYILVGENEADPASYKISIESPIGRALLDKKIGDTVKVEMPNGAEEFEIVAIK
jgi:transcription elongation factor GreA